MRFFQKVFAASLALAFIALFVPASHAQTNSNTGTVTLTANLAESLSVTVNSGAAITFTLAPNTATNAGSGNSSVTTAWTLKPGRTSVAVWAYFTSAASALVHQTAGNTTDIPSSAVKIQVGGAGLFNALTNVSPFNAAASGLQIGVPTGITGTNKTGTRTDTMAYQIDTTIVPQLPADAYIGTLNIQAQATP
jgi:sarcosine oxidase gamma subunit